MNEIKQTARELADRHGLIHLTRRMVAEAAGIPDGSFIAKAGCTFTQLVCELQEEGVGVGREFDGSRPRASHPELRRSLLVAAALDEAREVGYQQVTRQGVAKRANCAPSLVSHYFGNSDQLGTVIISAAVVQQDAEILAQGLANGDALAKTAPQELKEQAAKLLTE